MTQHWVLLQGQPAILKASNQAFIMVSYVVEKKIR